MKTTLSNIKNTVVEKFFDYLPAIVIITIIALIIGFFAGIAGLITYCEDKSEEKFMASANAISYETTLTDVTYDTAYKSEKVSFFAWFENNIGEEIRFEIPEEEYKQYIQAIGKTILVTADAGEENGEYVEKNIIVQIDYNEENLVVMKKNEPVITNNYQN